MKELLKIAVVIPTFNRPLQLAECLRSLAKSQCKVRRVLIVDASTNKKDTIKAILSDEGEWPFRVEYREASCISSAVQRNQGLSLLEDEDGVLFLDDDMVVEPDCLEELMMAFSLHNEEVCGAAANISNQPVGPPGFISRIIFWLMGGGWKKDYSGRLFGPSITLRPKGDGLPRFLRIEWASAGCILYHRSALPLGGFRSYFQGYSLGEDVAFSVDAQKYGVLLYASSARVIHTPGKSTHPVADLYGKMEVLNRWYIMNEVLQRRFFSDYLRFWIWMAWEFMVGLFLVVRNKIPWTIWKSNWSGRCSAFSEIGR